MKQPLSLDGIFLMHPHLGILPTGVWLGVVPISEVTRFFRTVFID